MPRGTTAKKPTPAAKEETGAVEAQVAPETTAPDNTETAKDTDTAKAAVVEVEEVQSASEKLVDAKVIKDFKAFYGTQHYIHKKSEKTVKLPTTLATMLEKSGKIIIR